MPVLIESDWNLKDSHSETHPNHRAVLIESDWNLKEAVKFKDLLPILTGINRIRLEFKATPATTVFMFDHSINRIRLEFKVGGHQTEDICRNRINRIILEFKDYLII